MQAVPVMYLYRSRPEKRCIGSAIPKSKPKIRLARGSRVKGEQLQHALTPPSFRVRSFWRRLWCHSAGCNATLPGTLDKSHVLVCLARSEAGNITKDKFCCFSGTLKQLFHWIDFWSALHRKAPPEKLSHEPGEAI